MGGGGTRSKNSLLGFHGRDSRYEAFFIAERIAQPRYIVDELLQRSEQRERSRFSPIVQQKGR